MVRRFISTISAAAFAAAMSAFAETPLLRTYRETTELSDAEFAEKRQFEITCHVIAVYANDTVLACDSGECFEVLFPRPSGAVPGQVAVLRGHTLYKIDTSQVRDLVGEKAETINYPPPHTHTHVRTKARNRLRSFAKQFHVLRQRARNDNGCVCRRHRLRMELHDPARRSRRHQRRAP